MSESGTVRTYFVQEMDSPAIETVGFGTCSVFSARCPGKSSPNEDAAALIAFGASSGVWAVADGLGGNASGEQASATAIRELVGAVEDAMGTDIMLRTAIINGFERANEAIQQLRLGAATTMAAVEVADSTIRPYHVGDSTILVVGSHGKIKLQTISHSPVGYGVEAGLLDETEAMYDENRHLVSNVIGSPAMRLEIGPTIRLSPRDTVLLATDGISDNLHSDEIVQLIRKGRIDRSAHSLASSTLGRMNASDSPHPSKPDDATFIMFRRDGVSRGAR